MYNLVRRDLRTKRNELTFEKKNVAKKESFIEILFYLKKEERRSFSFCSVENFDFNAKLEENCDAFGRFEELCWRQPKAEFRRVNQNLL